MMAFYILPASPLIAALGCVGTMPHGPGDQQPSSERSVATPLQQPPTIPDVPRARYKRDAGKYVAEGHQSDISPNRRRHRGQG